MRILPKRYGFAKMLSLGLLLVVVCALGLASVCSFTPRRAREVALREGLAEIRITIDAYTLDHQLPPKSFGRWYR